MIGEYPVIAENASFHSAYLPKMKNSASSLNTLYIAERAQFYSAFLPTKISLTLRFRQKREVWLRFFAENTQNDLRKRTVTKTALSLTSRFRRQRSAMIYAFGENGELSKTLNICVNFKNFFKNVGRTAFLHLLVSERCKKKFKNRLWKSRTCVPLSDCKPNSRVCKTPRSIWQQKD